MQSENGTLWLVTERDGSEALFYSGGRPSEWKRFPKADEIVAASEKRDWWPFIVVGVATAVSWALIALFSGSALRLIHRLIAER